MIQVNSTQVTHNLHTFFQADTAPGGFRFRAVLAGDITGKIWTDDPANPSWGIIQEAAYGTLYLEGQFPDGLLADFIEQRRQHGDVLYGFWADDDAMATQLPPPQYDGHVWESDQRSPLVDLSVYMQQIPPDCAIRPIDADLFKQMQDYPFYSDMFGSPERALERGFGFCLMRGDDILCESFAGTSYQNVIEMGVNTWEGHRQKGYATITCAYVIHEAEQRGWRTYWNCAAQNVASKALADKLGYAPMKPYRLMGWF